LDETLSSSDDFHVAERVRARAPWKFIDTLGKNHWFTALRNVFIALRIYLTMPATAASSDFKTD